MTDTTKDAVVTECDLPDAPEKVWRALTEPDLLAHWLPDAVGCEVLAAEPNRLLRYRWRTAEDEKDSFVTFELAETDDGGTHLRVDHRMKATVIAFRRSPPPSTPSTLIGSAEPTALLRRAA